MENRIVSNEDKTYKRGLYIVVIILSILALLGIALAIAIPYYMKYVPKPRSVNFDYTYIVKDTELEPDGKTLILTHENKDDKSLETLTISSEMDNVNIPNYQESKYMYHCKDITDTKDINISFKITSDTLTLKAVTLTITLSTAQGEIIKKLEKNDYIVDSLENNEIKTHFNNGKETYIRQINVNYYVLK